MLAQFPKPLTPMPSREPFGSDLSRPPAMIPVLALALLLSAVLVGLITVALP